MARSRLPGAVRSRQHRGMRTLNGRIWLAGALALLVQGCSRGESVADPSSCKFHGAKPMLVAELAFGRNVKGGPGVSDADWAEFQRDILTGQFPDGLTVMDAVGQWSDPRAKRMVSEPSKFVILAAPDTQATAQGLRVVTDAYKRRFGQESV
ncbi:MAG: DUF3574 domain-containing protein, partial [Acetobacteraceae bacterium]|nr:DUF3574 domain-containing protein [Acetobacteraceae bacterium]